MKKSKLHYIKLNKRINEKKFLEQLRSAYNREVKNTIFIKDNISGNDMYSCWAFEKSYLKLDNHTYLLKLSSGYSPNDTAGNFTTLDKDLKPIVLDLTTDADSYSPFGFRFSMLNDKESEVQEFFDDIKNYKDCNAGNFFYKNTKQELIDIIDSNNIDFTKFTDEVLDKLDVCYFNNINFDRNASESINKRFEHIRSIIKSIRLLGDMLHL